VTQPPNAGPPPPPPPFAPPPPPALANTPPPGAYAGPPAGAPAGHGPASPVKLIAVFVVVLLIGLGLGAAVVLALQPPAAKPDCPDPNVACSGPPVAPTLPPIAQASPRPAPTPAATIIRPSSSPAASGGPAPTSTPTGSAGPGSNIPRPRPAGAADALHVGAVWTSSSMGFRLEFDDHIWAIQDEGDSGLALTAGNGAVLVAIEGFDASSSSPKALVQQKVNSLQDFVLGLTDEEDPARQLPGTPVIGHRQGVGVVMNGAINTPQGPTAVVDVVILAATDSQISIRVTILTDDDLREPAFSVIDSILNSIEWPADVP